MKKRVVTRSGTWHKVWTLNTLHSHLLRTVRCMYMYMYVCVDMNNSHWHLCVCKHVHTQIIMAYMHWSHPCISCIMFHNQIGSKLWKEVGRATRGTCHVMVMGGISWWWWGTWWRWWEGNYMHGDDHHGENMEGWKRYYLSEDIWMGKGKETRCKMATVWRLCYCGGVL